MQGLIQGLMQGLIRALMQALDSEEIRMWGMIRQSSRLLMDYQCACQLQ